MNLEGIASCGHKSVQQIIVNGHYKTFLFNEVFHRYYSKYKQKRYYIKAIIWKVTHVFTWAVYCFSCLSYLICLWSMTNPMVLYFLINYTWIYMGQAVNSLFLTISMPSPSYLGKCLMYSSTKGLDAFEWYNPVVRHRSNSVLK